MDWKKCDEDIRVIDDDGETVLYDGPKWFRCRRMDCLTLVTWAYIEEGIACPTCHNHKLIAAAKLSPDEIEGIESGRIPLSFYEPYMVFGGAEELPPHMTRRTWGRGVDHGYFRDSEARGSK